MSYIKNKILTSLQNQGAQNQKLILYFSGTLNQCVILKTLLKETKKEILLYYFDKNKYCPESSDLKAKHERNLKIFEDYKKWYRNFESQEILLSSSDIKDVSNFDGLLFHAKLLSKVYDNFGGFDSYLISEDLSFFSNQLLVLDFYNQIQKHGLSTQLLAPFSTLKSQEISTEAFSGYLQNNEINFFKIYLDNKIFIDAFKSFNEKSNLKEMLEASSEADFHSIFRYLLWNSSFTTYVNFIKKLGHLVDKKLHIYHLTKGAFPFGKSFESPIALSIIQGNISDDELNQILLDLVERLVGLGANSPKNKIDEIDYFFRLYSYKISEDTKDQLLWKCFYGKDHNYNEMLLDKLVDWKCDIGTLLLRSIDEFPADQKSPRAMILLEQYQDKIHQLQLNEALLKAFKNNLYDLCHNLIAAGAEQKILQFHSRSYAMALWEKTRSKEIEIKRHGHWFQRDRVIISEILKELGNPQNKVPPVIHVTGSNGKGSTCALLRSILEENGYKAHAFSTPDIIRINEDIIIAGTEISDEDFYRYLTRVEEAYHRIKDSDDFKTKISEADKKDNLNEAQAKETGWLWYVMEIMTAVLAFSEVKADVTIVEVITGGELCLTNIFNEKTTIATIVNTIIFGDGHAGGKASFGDFSSVESVARTKSRLAKPGVPIFSAKQEDAVMKEIKKTADELTCPLFFLDKDFAVEDLDEEFFSYKGFGQKFKLYRPKLIGEFQKNNAAIALSILLNIKKFDLHPDKISKGIREAYQLGRCTEIDNSVISGYEKVYFGTTKGFFDYNELCGNFEIDVVQAANVNNSLYNSSFAKNLKKIKGHLLLFGRSDDNIELERLISKESNFVEKKYLSSSLVLMSQFKEKSKYLCVNTSSLRWFPVNSLQIMKQIHQKNFYQDLEFAKNHKLLNNWQISLLSDTSDDFSNHEYLAYKRVNYHEKIYILAAKELGIECKENQFRKIKFIKNNITHHLQIAEFQGLNNNESRNTCSDKQKSNEIAKKYFPVPAYIIQSLKESTSQENARLFLQENKQIVIKPIFGSMSEDVYFIRKSDQGGINALEEKLAMLKEKYDSVLLQQYIEGIEYRIYFVGDSPVHLTKKVPPVIVGDGKATIVELIDLWNDGMKNSFNDSIKIATPGIIQKNSHLDNFLRAKDYLLSSILPKNDQIFLNFGGIDRIFLTKEIIDIPNSILEKAKSFMKEIDLTLGGLDFIVKDDEWHFLEVSSTPGVQQYFIEKDQYRTDLKPAQSILSKLFIECA